VGADARRRWCEGVQSSNFVVFRFMVPRRPTLWLFVIDSASHDVGRRMSEKAVGILNTSNCKR